MGKYFCTDCGQRVDDVVCPICGSLAEDLRFDEGSPDGRSDRYDDSLLTRVGADADEEPDADETVPPEESDEESDDH